MNATGARQIIVLIGILALLGLALIVWKGSCVPGREKGCVSVYGKPGTHVCTSRGTWPEYCRLNDGSLQVK